MSRGQSSLEFLAMVSLSAILLAGMYTLALDKYQELTGFNEAQVADSVTDQVRFEAEMALVQGEGYSRVFSIPSEVSGEDYNVAVGRGDVLFQSSRVNSVSGTRYQGPIRNISTEKSNVYRVLNNGSVWFEPLG